VFIIFLFGMNFEFRYPLIDAQHQIFRCSLSREHLGWPWDCPMPYTFEAHSQVRAQQPQSCAWHSWPLELTALSPVSGV